MATKTADKVLKNGEMVDRKDGFEEKSSGSDLDLEEKDSELPIDLGEMFEDVNVDMIRISEDSEN